ncbi:unnamed protein product [Porites lobata]|uniref:TNFR-Cys domain-containing protein n=1 Tax=Porites lobata TaxID=104759 RepID=A0ABN8QY61_9CNID|nr:unnamed protein product [Porites lobata]
MYKICSLIVLSIIELVLATTSTSCPSAHHYWNGTSCILCTKCGPGYGVKTKCGEKQDTECQECWPGYDWSNNTSMEKCMDCVNEVSECLEGNFKIIRNCTTTSPTKCKGCAEGHYFDPGYGEHGGCIRCSKPCGIFQKETRKCETAHDRLCTARKLIDILGKTTTPVPGQTTNIPTSTPVQEQTTNSSSSSSSPNAVTVTKLPAQENVKNDVPEKATGENKLLFLLFLLFALIPIIGIAVFCCKRRKSRRPEKKDARKVEQTCPLMSRRSRGLDTLVRDLVVEDRRKISSWLNEKGTDGYYHYQLVSENLGFLQESRQWSRFDNPAEKFLTAFGEKENGTILKLVDASKQVGLTLFARKLEEKFGQTNQSREENEEDEGRICRVV